MAGSRTHETILDNMADGVVSVDRAGRIVTFNVAAARILGLAETEAPGQVFGEVFVLKEGLDGFTQAILDAVGERRETGQKFVEIDVDGSTRVLAVTTSYSHTDEAGGDPRIGVIAVFSDITEIRELRETEIRLGERVKAQYAELQDAYRVIEERNRELVGSLRRGRVVRGVAVAAVAVICAGTSVFVWDRSPVSIAALETASSGGTRHTTTVTVEPQPLRTSISISGRLAARQNTHVVSPIAGRVSEVHVRYGDTVEQGRLLVTLDTSEVVQEHRALRASFINADRRLQELENWDASRDMAAARRALSRARSTLEKLAHEVEETALLLEKGIIPGSEHEAAVDRHAGAELDYEALRQDLVAVQEEGSADAIEVARLEHRNLAEQLAELEAAMAQAAVRAPTSGVVLERPASWSGAGPGGGGRLVEGEEVLRGDPLLTIADVSGFAVVGTVDEVEIAKLRVAQPVTVTSDAFPDIRLDGAVTSVSSQAVNASPGAHEPAMFSIVATVHAVAPQVRPLLRLGMSADLHIVTRDEPAALLVPIDAVRRERDGSHSVHVLDPATDEVRSLAVETGATTQNAVEILSGLAPGDQVAVGGGGSP